MSITHWSWSITKQKKSFNWWDECSRIPQTSGVMGGGGKTWENWKKIEFGKKNGQKCLNQGLKSLDLVWYGLVMTQLWSLVNPEMSIQKMFYSNSLKSDSEIQQKWQNLGYFNFAFLETLTITFDFDFLDWT